MISGFHLQSQSNGQNIQTMMAGHIHRRQEEKKLEGVIQWVKNITYYLIFIRFISNLMPNEKYDKYVKLFSGAIFILILVSPLTGGLKIDEKLAFAFEKIRLQQDTSEFEQKLWGIEEEQTQKIITQYEEAVSRNIKEMAYAAGFFCQEAKVTIEKRREEESFGQIQEIFLVLDHFEYQEAASRDLQVWDDGQEVVIAQVGRLGQIEPVRIQVEQDAHGVLQEPDEQSRKETAEHEWEELYGFQREVAGYYGLEEKDVRIQWNDEKRELDYSAVRRAYPHDFGRAFWREQNKREWTNMGSGKDRIVKLSRQRFQIGRRNENRQPGSMGRGCENRGRALGFV